MRRCGIASFDLIRHHRNDDRVFLYGFDLIELNGDDLRRDPLQVRKVTLTSVLAKAGAGIRFNSTWKATVRPSSATPASLGLEFIVSKRKDSGSIRATVWESRSKAPREPSGGLFRCAVGKLLLVHPRQIPRDIDIVVQTACNQGA